MPTKIVRFRMHNGYLEPLEPVELVEGTEFDIQVSEAALAAAGVPAEVIEKLRRAPDVDAQAVPDKDRPIQDGKAPVRSDADE